MKSKHFSLITSFSLLLALLGVADSVYLLIKHYTFSPVVCGPFIAQCDSVLSSSYSEVFGVPLALGGVVFYAALVIFLVSMLIRQKQMFARLYMAITCFGIIFSAHFVYLQIRVLHEICTYCMVSASISTLLFILGIFIFRHIIPVTYAEIS
ncbi:MAG: vitamin K epoxide reductase family protein [Candidatus Paceibacterota bacterium]|jgi:uncharacterized membrane protein